MRNDYSLVRDIYNFLYKIGILNEVKGVDVKINSKIRITKFLKTLSEYLRNLLSIDSAKRECLIGVIRNSEYIKIKLQEMHTYSRMMSMHKPTSW